MEEELKSIKCSIVDLCETQFKEEKITQLKSRHYSRIILKVIKT